MTTRDLAKAGDEIASQILSAAGGDALRQMATATPIYPISAVFTSKNQGKPEKPAFACNGE